MLRYADLAGPTRQHDLDRTGSGIDDIFALETLFHDLS